MIGSEGDGDELAASAISDWVIEGEAAARMMKQEVVAVVVMLLKRGKWPPL